MSLTLSIKANSIPSPEEFLEQIGPLFLNQPASLELGETLLICSEIAEDRLPANRWQLKTDYTFYVMHLSSRGVSVCWDGKKFQLTIMSLSSVEDWYLALHILEFAAESPFTVVTTDWEPAKISLPQLKETYAEDFINRALRLQVSNLISEVIEKEVTVILDGPHNSFHLGPWYANRIISSYDDPDESIDEIVSNLINAMRVVQYIFAYPSFTDQFPPAECRSVKLKGKKTPAAVLRPERACFVPADAEALLFSGFANANLALKAEDFHKHLPEYFEEGQQLSWFDENQFVLTAISENDFRNFVNGVQSICTLV